MQCALQQNFPALSGVAIIPIASRILYNAFPPSVCLADNLRIEAPLIPALEIKPLRLGTHGGIWVLCQPPRSACRAWLTRHISRKLSAPCFRSGHLFPGLVKYRRVPSCMTRHRRQIKRGIRNDGICSPAALKFALSFWATEHVRFI